METRIFKERKTKDGTKKVLAVSYSQMSTFLQCGGRWFKYYLCGLGEPDDTESTELGTQIHAAIETYCMKLKEGYKWSLGEVVDLVQGNLDKREIKFKQNEDEVIVQQHLEMAESLFIGEHGLGKLLKNCDVIGQEIEFHLPFKLPFDVIFDGEIYNEVEINGFIDLLLKDKNTGELIVVDHKTSKKIFDEEKLWKDYQFPIYSLVILNMYGRLPTKCYYNFTRFDTLIEAPALVYKDDDSKIVKYYVRGKNKGKPKYIIKSINMVTKELTDIFKMMYAPDNISDYKYNPTSLCSWCTFGIYGDRTCVNQKKPPYIRKDLPVPKGYSVNPYKRKKGWYYGKSRN